MPDVDDFPILANNQVTNSDSKREECPLGVKLRLKTFIFIFFNRIPTHFRCVKMLRLIKVPSRYLVVDSNNQRFLIDEVRAAARSSKSGLTPLKLYNSIITSGHIKPDENQIRAVKHLDKLFHSLQTQQNPKSYEFKPEKEKFFIVNSRWFSQSEFSKWYGKITDIAAQKRRTTDKLKDVVYELEVDAEFDSKTNKLPDPEVRGVYLYGDVGCGKTFLMDLFHESVLAAELDKNSESKKLKIRRVHFHRFMMDVHKKLHEASKNVPKINSYKYTPADIIPPVAEELAKDSWILCFDEFQVVDISDAMILRRLFTELWKRGIVIVTTGNRKMEDLYKGGLQYQNFEPFIPMLQQHADQVDMTSGVDYRKVGDSLFGNTYFIKNEDDESAKTEFREVLQKLTNKTPEQMTTSNLTVFGRKIEVTKSHKRVAYFNFNDLCVKPLGSNDYLTIAEHFDCVFIENLPQIDLQTRKSEARRFITLIDTLYDERIGVVILASHGPEDLFVVNNSSEEWTQEFRDFIEQFYGGERGISDDAMKEKGKNKEFMLTSGEDEKFALARLVSRLTEMKSESYWEDVLRRLARSE